jgi:EAL domain-containing protein (putative c-di-GMP-specific phosphodiesterase class I)/GGDEF domain-containing protein/PAS domain-containing protein
VSQRPSRRVADARPPLPALPARPGGAATIAPHVLDAILAALGHPAWIVDGHTGLVVAANGLAAFLLARDTLVGLEAEELLDTIEDLAFWEAASNGRTEVLESDCTLYPEDGRICHVARRIAPLPLAQGAPLFLVQLRDRTREHRIELERETALAELRATLEATADAILVTDLNGRIRAFNRRFAALWALPDAVLHASDDRAVHAWLRMNVMDLDGYDRRLEEVFAHTLAEAQDTLALVNGAAIERRAQPQWSHGRPIGRVFSFREVNRRRAGAPAQAGCPGVDQLTNLPNRTGFLEAVEQALVPCTAGDGFAVLCLEFDRDALFGEGGDSAAGVRRLSELAARVRGTLRRPHHCARLGGSRFGVLIEHAGEAVAEAAARRLIETQRADVPVAIGIGAYPGAGLTPDEILRHVEIAMHRAQAQHQAHSGFAVHRFGFEAWQSRRDRIEAGLRPAAAEGRLRLVAQPRFAATAPGDAGTAARAIALEVGLRWRDRELGEISPAQFMSVARERGLVGSLDDWVLEQGLHAAARWRAAGHRLRLDVGVSAWQLTQPGHARRVAAALEAAGWPAEDLEIHVDEAALQADPEAAVAAVRALARQGVRVLLDAFGAGASALSWLQRLPLAGVKLDASLAQACAGAAAGSRWVPALVQLAHALGLEVLADGVDTEAQHVALLAAGCDGLQGRRLGAWMEERALDAWLSLQPPPG